MDEDTEPNPPPCDDSNKHHKCLTGKNEVAKWTIEAFGVQY